jgi:hypothetical protein
MTTTIRSVALAGLVLVLAATVRPAGAQEAGVFPFDYDRIRLDNGFTGYLIDAGAPGQIAFLTMVRTGSRDEVEPGKSGFAHFFEHMMFRGTEKYPDAEGMKRRLLDGEPTPITYAGERSREVLEEDRIVASFPIRVREENITILPIAEVLER